MTEEHDRLVTEAVEREGLKRAPEWFEHAYEDVLYRRHGVLSGGGKAAAADLWETIVNRPTTQASEEETVLNSLSPFGV